MRFFCYFSTMVLGLFLSSSLCAADGPLGIDHRLDYDNSGIWDRQVQLNVINGLLAVDVAGALWLGHDTRLGKTFWYSMDATLAGTVSSQILKRVFSRKRPIDSESPNEWFANSGHQSFPSGEVTVMTAMVTPFILEYRHDYPAVYALELLPFYDAVARMKVRGHWQTDVLAGFALGTGVSLLAHSRQSPWLVSVLPDGITIGVHTRF